MGRDKQKKKVYQFPDTPVDLFEKYRLNYSSNIGSIGSSAWEEIGGSCCGR